MSQEFGGVWTIRKLEILEGYLGFFTMALGGRFRLHYVDAFAGTGASRPRQIEEQVVFLPVEDMRGSAKVALETEPPFHEYHFNEIEPEKLEQLEDVCRKHPGRKVHVSRLDANEFVRRFASGMTRRDRAVLFLDPFSTQLDWGTLEVVARTEKIDLWFLFPLSAVLRMMPRRQVVSEWRATLDRLLGTNDWETALYQQESTPGNFDMFDSVESNPTERVNHRAVGDWVCKRLSELFGYVAPPFQLNNRGRPLFLFFLAVSNRSDKSRQLADKVHRHMQRKYGTAQ